MIARNAAASVGQVIVGAVVMFMLYLAILEMLGAEQLGIWSIVVATASVSRIGELGLAAGVTRFVAMYRARGEHRTAAHTVQTAAISVAALFGVISVPAYILLSALFEHIIPIEALDESRILLRYALISLVLTSVAGVFQSGLDGCQRYDRRVLLVITGQLLFLASALALAPRYGLVGLVWAQIGQGVLLLVAGWLLLRYTMAGLPWFPWNWRKASFREMLSYGLQFQFGSIANLLFDPLTKALLGKYGGLAAAGHYEMASQFVTKTRSLVVSANQVMVPIAAGLNERVPGRLPEVYRANMRLLVFLVLPLFAAAAAWAPLLSEIWIGRYERQFVFFSVLLAIAWCLNTLNTPAYFMNMGTGRIFWNTAAHVWAGLANAGLGLTLGPRYGATGVASGTALALVSGSAWIVYGFHRERRISWHQLLPRESFPLVAAGLFAVVAANACFHFMSHDSEWRRYLACLFIPPAILLPVLWRHPLRSAIKRRILIMVGR